MRQFISLFSFCFSSLFAICTSNPLTISWIYRLVESIILLLFSLHRNDGPKLRKCFCMRISFFWRVDYFLSAIRYDQSMYAICTFTINFFLFCFLQQVSTTKIFYVCELCKMTNERKWKYVPFEGIYLGDLLITEYQSELKCIGDFTAHYITNQKHAVKRKHGAHTHTETRYTRV